MFRSNASHIAARPYNGCAILTCEVDQGIFKLLNEYENSPREWELTLSPIYESKSSGQIKKIWANINEIANRIGASKDEVYEICIRRYGQGTAGRFTADGIRDLRRMYQFVDLLDEKEIDGTMTYFVKAYRGLSTYDTKEASILLDGVLSELKEIE